jgi:oligopeptide transport system substrate-binding protein
MVSLQRYFDAATVQNDIIQEGPESRLTDPRKKRAALNMTPYTTSFVAAKCLYRLFILTMLLSLGSCGTDGSRVETGNRDKILHFGNSAEPQELDPHIVTGIPENRIITALLEGLVAKDPQTLEAVPAVAESWELSADGKTYIFHLRDNARWSNGDPLTAEDFIWSWWRALQPALGNQYAYMLFSVVNAEAYASGEITDFSQVGVKALDKFTLVVSLNNPTPYFLQLLDHYSTYPVHRATIEKFGQADERGTRWTRAGNYVGNGPFVLDTWQLNRVIKVRKNPWYWDADAVQLNGIDFHPVENVSTEERMFRAGQLHITATVPIDKLPWYRAHNPTALHIAPYLGTYFYRLNVNTPHLKDKRVRQALNLAIDRQAIVDSVTKGGELPATTFTPPDTMGYTAESYLFFDPEEARRLMTAAGYPDGKGFPVTELLYNTSEGHRKIAVAIQQMWHQYLNVDISLNNQDWKVFLNSVNLMEYSIARAGWIGDYVDPNTFLDMWVSGGGNNQTGWSNARYDEIVLKLAPAAATQNERYALLKEAEYILLDEAPIIPLYIYTSKSLIQPSVHGVYSNLMDYIAYKQVWLEGNEEK